MAVGLGIGCVLTGCCPGRPIDETSPLAAVELRLHGAARFPASLVEAYFHTLAAFVILACMRRGIGRTARLTAYLAAYGVFRFGIEAFRDVPRPFGGLSYYQLLALVLACIASIVTIARLRAPVNGRTELLEG